MTIIKTISFGKEKEQVFLEFKKIAAREGKDTSKMLVSLMEEYVKQHSSGNPSFTLEQFQDPNFHAVPTILATLDIWDKHFTEANEKERDELNRKVVELKKRFYQIQVNENRK